MARGDGHGLGDSLGGVGANLLGDLTAVGLDAHVAKKIGENIKTHTSTFNTLASIFPKYETLWGIQLHVDAQGVLHYEYLVATAAGATATAGAAWMAAGATATAGAA